MRGPMLAIVYPVPKMRSKHPKPTRTPDVCLALSVQHGTERFLLYCEISRTTSAVFSGSSTRVATSAWEMIPTSFMFSFTTGIRRN